MGLLDDAIREHLDLKRRRGADPAEVERLEREALGPVRRPGFEHEEGVLLSEYPAEPAYGEEAAEAQHAPEASEPVYVDEPDYVEPGEEEPLVDEAPEYQPPQQPAGEPAPASPRHHEIAEAWDAHEAAHGPAAEETVEEEPATLHEPAGPVPPPPVHAESPAPEPDVPLAATPSPEPAEGQPGRRPHHGDTLDEETAEFDVEAAHEHEAEAGHDRGAEADHDREAPDDMLEETPDFLQDTPEHDRLWFEQRPPRDFDFDG